MTRPSASDYAAFYGTYVDLVPETDVLAALADSPTAALVAALDADALRQRYAPGKWTVGEVVQHVIDTERVFCTRALRFARGDETPLPGFDQDLFVSATAGHERTGDSLAGEMQAVRASTLALFRSLPDEAWDRSGTASGHRMTARAAAFVITGHERHHAAILQQRYGIG